MADLVSISSLCGNSNRGGFLRLRYAPIDWINSALFEPSIGPTYTQLFALPFLPSYDWLEMPIHADPRRWTEKQVNDKQGTRYQIKITGRLPFHSQAIAEQLDLMALRSFIITLDDRNGLPWFCGSLHFPLRLLSSFDTGDGSGKFKHHKLEFYGDFPHKAPAYDPPLIYV